MSFEIHSSAFRDGAEIPVAHTGFGADESPPLTWNDPPKGTRSFVLICEDPDAPDPAHPQRIWTHWVVYDIPQAARALDKGASHSLRSGHEGLNDWKKSGWNGPKPPIGRHRYFFKLYALDIELGPIAQPTRAKVLSAMKGHILAETEVIGTYPAPH